MILRISLNLSLDASYKQSRFSQTLLEKDFKFFSNREDSTVAFYLSLVLLLAEVDLIAEKQGCKKNVFRAYSIGYIKIIFAVSA